MFGLGMDFYLLVDMLQEPGPIVDDEVEAILGGEDEAVAGPAHPVRRLLVLEPVHGSVHEVVDLQGFSN